MLECFRKNVLDGLRKAAEETFEELTANDPKAKKVYDSFRSFKSDVKKWMDVSEKVFYETL